MTKRAMVRTLASMALASVATAQQDADRISCRATDPAKVAELKRLAQEKRDRKAKLKQQRSGQ